MLFIVYIVYTFSPCLKDVLQKMLVCYSKPKSSTCQNTWTQNELRTLSVVSGCIVWSAICFKIMTRYTCGFFPRILAIIPATRYTCVFCHVYLRFIPKYMTIFLQTRIYMRTKKPIYLRYKQACGIWGHRKSSCKRHRIIPSAKNPFMYDGAEK